MGVKGSNESKQYCFSKTIQVTNPLGVVVEIRDWISKSYPEVSFDVVQSAARIELTITDPDYDERRARWLCRELMVSIAYGSGHALTILASHQQHTSAELVSWMASGNGFRLMARIHAVSEQAARNVLQTVPES